MKNQYVEIRWQDIYTVGNGTLDEIKADLDTHAQFNSVGSLVYEDKRFIVLLQNACNQKSDFIVIPKAVILARRVLK